MPNSLEVRDLSVAYGAIQAVRGASFNVGRGEVVALLGPNGAGKTTIAKAVTGLVAPNTGSITLDGSDVTRSSPQARAGLGLSIVPEGRRVFPGLTVVDNLLVGAFRWRKDRSGVRQSLAQVYELFPRLDERQVQLGGSLSGGEQQMLALGRALMSRPRVLILDEPSLGLAPMAIRVVYDALRHIRDDGTGLLLIEQSSRLIATIASRVHFVTRGEVSPALTPDAIQSYAREHYLGTPRQAVAVSTEPPPTIE